MVNLGGVCRPFGGLRRAPGVMAVGFCIQGTGRGLRMRWTDCLANFGPYDLTLPMGKPRFLLTDRRSILKSRAKTL